MVEEFYLTGGAWTSSVLHGHFVDQYSAFKQAICQLSFSGSAKKRPSACIQGNPDVEEYLDTINNLLQSGSKKYHSKKWWNHDAAEMIYPLHFAYAAEFSSGKQSTSWLAEKSSEHKSKFETDQKIGWRNRLRNGRQRKRND
jgi:hypothetical protein